jgi:hypothetical protein
MSSGESARADIIGVTALIAATDRVRQLREALGKFALARLRGIGIAKVHPDWEARAAICEQCPMRVVRCGVSYCGTPYLQQIDREPAVDGCGCPCRAKAQSPGEHCPIDARHRAAATEAGSCNCKWCRAALPS